MESHVKKNRNTDPDNFLTISDIERLSSELRGDTNLLYSDMLASLLAEIDETEVIHKKTEYRNKGIVLQTNKRYSRSILTTNGWLAIERYVLLPKEKADASRLMDLEGVKTEVPLDDYLQPKRTPFQDGTGSYAERGALGAKRRFLSGDRGRDTASI